LRVTITENLWIPMADGTRLAARLWLPDGAGTTPVPAILEYIPYRKRDGTRGRDEPMHGFFAAEGYAVLRVDMRGSGESDGLLDDEYLALEQDDAVEVIAWIAAQPWCAGAVGMMGKSWGGFNALQVAARRPPALKAIITVCSTDDRFSDDIHYAGGCLLNDNLWWGAIMLAYQGRPPDPAIVGPGWREQWLARLDHMPCWPALWMAHQDRDAYWQHGSVNEDFSAIACPVFAVGGWADAYTNAIPRLLEHLHVPRLGLIGPWAHIYPQDGVPEPAVDFLGEATRWWDQWLKGRETGIMGEPMLRAYVEDWRAPTATLPQAPGRFVGERVWPSPRIAPMTVHLGVGRLLSAREDHAPLSIRSPLWTGTAGGEWMGTGVPGEMPGDQRVDDGLSLCFDTAPLDEDVEILGFPRIDLALSSDSPHAQLAARLCAVAPDGTSLRVSYGVLNLSHRDGSAAPAPMRPGAVEHVSLALNAAGHRFRKGHRIRLAISTAYWPLVWPSRDAATLTLHAGGRLTLPVRPVAGGGEDPVLAAPPRTPKTPTTLLRAGRMERQVVFDGMTGMATVTTRGEGGLFGEGVRRFDEIGVSLSHDLTRRLSIDAGDPLSARATIEQRYEMERQDGLYVIETVLTLCATADEFELVGRLDAYEREHLVRTREWHLTIPRLHL
jgi:predicted acyl esterase